MDPTTTPRAWRSKEEQAFHEHFNDPRPATFNSTLFSIFPPAGMPTRMHHRGEAVSTTGSDQIGQPTPMRSPLNQGPMLQDEKVDRRSLIGPDNMWSEKSSNERGVAEGEDADNLDETTQQPQHEMGMRGAHHSGSAQPPPFLGGLPSGRQLLQAPTVNPYGFLFQQPHIQLPAMNPSFMGGFPAAPPPIMAPQAAPPTAFTFTPPILVANATNGNLTNFPAQHLHGNRVGPINPNNPETTFRYGHGQDRRVQQSGKIELIDAPKPSIKLPTGVRLGAIELLTYYPHHLQWPDAMFRLFGNDWESKMMAMAQYYARGYFTKGRIIRRDNALRKQAVVNKAYLQRIGATRPGANTHYDATNFAPRNRLVGDAATLLSLAKNIVHFPTGQDEGVLTKAVLHAQAMNNSRWTTDDLQMLIGVHGWADPTEALGNQWDQSALDRLIQTMELAGAWF